MQTFVNPEDRRLFLFGAEAREAAHYSNSVVDKGPRGGNAVQWLGLSRVKSDCPRPSSADLPVGMATLNAGTACLGWARGQCLSSWPSCPRSSSHRSSWGCSCCPRPSSPLDLPRLGPVHSMPDTDDHVKVERSAGLDAAAPEPRKPRLQGFLGLVGRLDYVPPSCRWNPSPLRASTG